MCHLPQGLSSTPEAPQAVAPAPPAAALREAAPSDPFPPPDFPGEESSPLWTPGGASLREGPGLPPPYQAPGPSDVVPGAPRVQRRRIRRITDDAEDLDELTTALRFFFRDVQVGARKRPSGPRMLADAAQALRERTMKALREYDASPDAQAQALLPMLRDHVRRIDDAMERLATLPSQRPRPAPPAPTAEASTAAAEAPQKTVPNSQEPPQPIETPAPISPAVAPEPPVPPTPEIPVPTPPTEEVFGAPAPPARPATRVPSVPMEELGALVERANLSVTATLDAVAPYHDGTTAGGRGGARDALQARGMRYDDAFRAVDVAWGLLAKGEGVPSVPPAPPTPIPPVPPTPKPVPEATIANAGTPYRSQQNADFALTHKKGVNADTHEVVEREGYGWFIVPKGSAVPPARPQSETIPAPTEPTVGRTLLTPDEMWRSALDLLKDRGSLTRGTVAGRFRIPDDEAMAILQRMVTEGYAQEDPHNGPGTAFRVQAPRKRPVTPQITPTPPVPAPKREAEPPPETGVAPPPPPLPEEPPVAPTPPAPPPKAKRLTKGQQAEANRAQLLADYFTPGAIIPGYSGLDRVIAFDPETENATVIRVTRNGDPVPGSWERTHHTHPSERQMRQALARRPPKPPEEPPSPEPAVPPSPAPPVPTAPARTAPPSVSSTLTQGDRVRYTSDKGLTFEGTVTEQLSPRAGAPPPGAGQGQRAFSEYNRAVVVHVDTVTSSSGKTAPLDVQHTVPTSAIERVGVIESAPPPTAPAPAGATPASGGPPPLVATTERARQQARAAEIKAEDRLSVAQAKLRKAINEPYAMGSLPQPEARAKVSEARHALHALQSASRAAAANLVLGAESAVVTPRNAVAHAHRLEALPTRFAVINADQAVHSFEPGYPPDLQPRLERQAGAFDPASEQTIQQIVTHPDFERLGVSREATTGAPILNEDLQSLSGSARLEALKRIYQAGGATADALQQFAFREGARLGIPAGALMSLSHPILVRILDIPLSRAEQKAFAEEANERSSQAPSAISQTMQDAGRLTPEILRQLVVRDDGMVHLLGQENASFREAVLAQVIPSQEHGIMVADNEWTIDGANRLRRMIFAKAYGQSPALERLALSETPERKNVGQAMLAIAPALARLQETIRIEGAYPLDLAPDLVAAANHLVTLSEQGETVANWLAQGALFDTGLSAIAKDLIQLFDRARFKRSAKAMTGLLATYLERVDALGSPQQRGLFGVETPPTIAETLQAAVRRFEEHSGAQETTLPGLFPAEPETSESHRGTAEPRAPFKPVGSGKPSASNSVPAISRGQPARD